MQQRKKQHKVAIVSFIASVVIIAVSVAVFIQRQVISDTLSSLMFHPTVEVKAIEKSLGLTNDAHRIFYATQPELLDAAEFNERCPRQESKSPIIGCYVTGADRLYIYNVENSNLDGIEEVTAAHEFLHAAWYRLNEGERQRLGDLLEREYERIDDESLTERVAYYKRTQPNDIHNELHSIIGTEYNIVNKELLSHYEKYFTQRSSILAFHDKYSDTYKTLHSESSRLSTEMQAISVRIQDDQVVYREDAKKLTADITSFNNRAQSGVFSSQYLFYNERAALTSRSNILEGLRVSINKNIEKYNGLRAEYLEVSSKIETLNKSVDSFETLEVLPTL